MEIGPTALKRKWTRDDILHALEHRHIDYDIKDDDPPRTWVFGFARDLTLLELLILHDTPGGRVIHLHEGPSERTGESPPSTRQAMN